MFNALFAAALLCTAQPLVHPAQDPAAQPQAVPAPSAAPPAVPLPAPRPAPSNAPEQRWKGAITIPPETRLEIYFTLRGDPSTPGDGQSGTLSIPAQMLKDGPLDELRFDGEIMSFRLPIKTAEQQFWPVFELNVGEGGKTAEGSMRQAGQNFDVKAEQLAEGETAGPKRPQTPKPPFAYETREVLFDGAGGAKLAGTLTIPSGSGKHPCAVLLTGSGPQDRDETLFEHKPFAVIADHLSRRGVAVLRFDDRGVGGSTSPKNGEETTDDFALDAIEAVKFVAGLSEIDPAKVGLIGHSEGALSASIAAAASDKIAFVVLLAGPGVPGRQILERQLVELMRAALPPAPPAGEKPEVKPGEQPAAPAADPEKTIADASAAQKKLLSAVAENKTKEEIRVQLRDLIAVQAGVKLDDPAVDPETRKIIEDQARMQAAMMTSAWMKRFLVLDPREYLAKVKVPLLALNGSLDRQVPPDQSLPEIEKALKQAGNKDATTKLLKGLNHLFQPARTGAIVEYPEIEITFAPVALEEIAAFVRSRCGLTAK